MKRAIKILKLFTLCIAFVLLLTCILFGYRDIPLATLNQKYTSNSSSFLELNSMKVHYREEGNKKDSIPLVFIHGTGASLHTFDAWTNKLKKEYRVIRMDLPGYGLTGPFPNSEYSTENYLLFLNQFLDSLKINKCILAGNSLGGEIGWNFALKHPEKVEKLILIDAAGYPNDSKNVPLAFKLTKIPVVKNIFTFITPKFVVQSSVENVYYDKTKVTDSLVDRYFELSLREGNRQAFIDRFARKKDTSAYHQIKNIKQPTLIIWGENDYLIPKEKANLFHENLPNSSLVILKNTGHVPMEENPEESLNSVYRFLNKKSEPQIPNNTRIKKDSALFNDSIKQKQYLGKEPLIGWCYKLNEKNSWTKNCEKENEWLNGKIENLKPLEFPNAKESKYQVEWNPANDLYFFVWIPDLTSDKINDYLDYEISLEISINEIIMTPSLVSKTNSENGSLLYYKLPIWFWDLDLITPKFSIKKKIELYGKNYLSDSPSNISEGTLYGFTTKVNRVFKLFDEEKDGKLLKTIRKTIIEHNFVCSFGE